MKIAEDIHGMPEIFLRKPIDPLYHGTTWKRAYIMSKANIMRKDTIETKGALFGVSFSKLRSYALQYGSFVFEFSGEKLFNNYKIVDFNKTVDMGGHSKIHSEYCIEDKIRNFKSFVNCLWIYNPKEETYGFYSQRYVAYGDNGLISNIMFEDALDYLNDVFIIKYFNIKNEPRFD